MDASTVNERRRNQRRLLKEKEGQNKEGQTPRNGNAGMRRPTQML